MTASPEETAVATARTNGICRSGLIRALDADDLVFYFVGIAESRRDSRIENSTEKNIKKTFDAGFTFRCFCCEHRTLEEF